MMLIMAGSHSGDVDHGWNAWATFTVIYSCLFTFALALFLCLGCEVFNYDNLWKVSVYA